MYGKFGQGRPGGMRGGLLCYRRFLPEGPPGGLQFLLLDLTRLSPQEGLAVFKRYAHSAGPD